jgi:hypothetical protein
MCFILAHAPSSAKRAGSKYTVVQESILKTALFSVCHLLEQQYDLLPVLKKYSKTKKNENKTTKSCRIKSDIKNSFIPNCANYWFGSQLWSNQT